MSFYLLAGRLNPGDNEDYAANFKSLYEILRTIQDAINVADKRQWHKSIPLDISPTRAFCTAIYEDSFYESSREGERINEAFSSNRRESSTGFPEFSPDFTLIKKHDCSPDGVKAVAATIQAWMARYDLTFTQLERYRDNLARVNDVFAGEIGHIAANLRNIPKLEKAKKIYIEAKETIEKTIDNFLSRVNYLHYEIRKLLQEYYGRNVGWGYHLSYPSSHFLVIIRRTPLFLNRPIELNDQNDQITKMWVTDNLRRSRRVQPDLNELPVMEDLTEINVSNTIPRAKRSENPTEFENDSSDSQNPYFCVKDISSLDQLVHGLTTAANKTVQIFAFREDARILDIQIKHLRSIFFAWLNTSKGWFQSYWYANAFNNVLNLFDHFEHDVLRNLHVSSIPNKKTVINTLIHHVIIPHMNSDLGWYYNPTSAIEKIRDFLKDHISILESEVPDNNLKVNMN